MISRSRWAQLRNHFEEFKMRCTNFVIDSEQELLNANHFMQKFRFYSEGKAVRPMRGPIIHWSDSGIKCNDLQIRPEILSMISMNCLKPSMISLFQILFHILVKLGIIWFKSEKGIHSIKIGRTGTSAAIFCSKYTAIFQMFLK